MYALIEFILRGALIGVTYGLVALPISLLFVTTDSVDIAVGGYAVLAAALALIVPGPPGVALGILAAIIASAAAGIISLQIVRPGASNAITGVLATLGVAGFLESLVLTLYGKDPMIRQPFDHFWSIAGIRVSPQAGINLAVGLGILAALSILLFRTPYGRVMRASAVNPLGAALAGIPVRLVWFSTYLLGGLLAGIAGILILYTSGISYSSGLPLTTWSFGASILFGLRGPERAFLGGLAMGTVEGLSSGYLSGAWADSTPLVFIFLVLASGRTSQKGVAGVRA